MLPFFNFPIAKECEISPVFFPTNQPENLSLVTSQLAKQQSILPPSLTPANAPRYFPFLITHSIPKLMITAFFNIPKKPANSNSLSSTLIFEIIYPPPSKVPVNGLFSSTPIGVHFLFL